MMDGRCNGDGQMKGAKKIAGRFKFAGGPGLEPRRAGSSAARTYLARARARPAEASEAMEIVRRALPSTRAAWRGSILSASTGAGAFRGSRASGPGGVLPMLFHGCRPRAPAVPLRRQALAQRVHALSSVPEHAPRPRTWVVHTICPTLSPCAFFTLDGRSRYKNGQMRRASLSTASVFAGTCTRTSTGNPSLPDARSFSLERSIRTSARGMDSWIIRTSK